MYHHAEAYVTVHDKVKEYHLAAYINNFRDRMSCNHITGYGTKCSHIAVVYKDGDGMYSKSMSCCIVIRTTVLNIVSNTKQNTLTRINL